MAEPQFDDIKPIHIPVKVAARISGECRANGDKAAKWIEMRRVRSPFGADL